MNAIYFHVNKYMGFHSPFALSHTGNAARSENDHIHLILLVLHSFEICFISLF